MPASTTRSRRVDPLRHQHGLGRRRRAVVDRVVGDVHPEQVADQGLELERVLQRALADLGLIRRVRGVELRRPMMWPTTLGE